MVNIKDVLKIITYLCVVCGYASVVPYVQIVYNIGFLALFGLAVYLDITGAARVPRWVLNTLSVSVLMVSLLRVTPEYLVEPILNALIILVAIKLLEDKQFRDYMQIYAMCMFLLIGSSFISLSIIFLVYFSILATLSTVSLILLAYFSQNSDMSIRSESIVKIVYHALLICAISIPASTVFFVILPRTNFPLLSFLNQSGYGRSGFSDKVVLGEVSEIQEDESVIFRAEMNQVNEADLYWRGIVLDSFDGRQWRRGAEVPTPPAKPLEGRKIFQTIYLEPYGDKFLFALDRPTSLILGGARGLKSFSFGPTKHPDTLTYSVRDFLHERIRYSATSVISEALPDELINVDRYLQLPPEFSLKIKNLSESLTVSQGDAEKVQSLLKFIKWGDFRYSLENLSVSKTPLEDFLLVRKQGNCEYFASALAVMLRYAGIPSRLIGGYKGGYYNKTGKYYLVLQKNAHVWVEARLADRGWIRLDPTPYTMIAPSEAYQRTLLMQVKLLLDTFNYYWYKLVINYDLSRQLAIISSIQASFRKQHIKLQLGSLDFKKYLSWGFLLLAAVFIIFGIRKGRRPLDQKLLDTFVTRMNRHGYQKQTNEGLEEFVAKVEEADLQERASRFVKEFEKVFYKDHPFTRDEAKRLEAVIKDL